MLSPPTKNRKIIVTIFLFLFLISLINKVSKIEFLDTYDNVILTVSATLLYLSITFRR